MKKNIGIIVSILVAVSCLVYFYVWIRMSDSNIEKFIPAERCVKSGYNKNDNRYRISVNCRDFQGNAHTVVLREFKSEEDLDRIDKAFANGIHLDGFVCTNLNGLHTCFQRENGIMVTSFNKDSVVFFVLQFNEHLKPKSNG
ncbi:hypothetical protein [Paracidovorax avenae]|uniref:hypothetical protein n=1 Tax=Paracidovorax avenae TaxID=80867 RepID=UPI0012601347|nr:hypothetical protein [Paracidovorax avenae]